MEFLKDYDISIFYHLDMANIVANLLSQKAVSMNSLADMSISQRPLA